MADDFQDDYLAVDNYPTDTFGEEYTAIDMNCTANSDHQEAVYQNFTFGQQQSIKKPVENVAEQLAKLNKRAQSKNTIPTSAKQRQQINTKNRVIPAVPPSGHGGSRVKDEKKSSRDEDDTLAADSDLEIYSEPREFRVDDVPLIKFSKLDPEQNTNHKETGSEIKNTGSDGHMDIVPPIRTTSRRRRGRRLTCPIILGVIFLLSVAANILLIFYTYTTGDLFGRNTSDGTGTLTSWYDSIFKYGAPTNVASMYAGTRCTSSAVYGDKAYNQSQCQYALDGRETWTGEGEAAVGWLVQAQEAWIDLDFGVVSFLRGLELVHPEGILGEELILRVDNITEKLNLTEHPSFIGENNLTIHRIFLPELYSRMLNITATSDGPFTGLSEIRIFGYSSRN